MRYSINLYRKYSNLYLELEKDSCLYSFMCAKFVRIFLPDTPYKIVFIVDTEPFEGAKEIIIKKDCHLLWLTPAEREEAEDNPDYEWHDTYADLEIWLLSHIPLDEEEEKSVFVKIIEI